MKLRYVPRLDKGKRKARETAALVALVAALVLPGVPIVLRDTYPRLWCAAKLPACRERRGHEVD